jgi:hypothetical protein
VLALLLLLPRAFSKKRFERLRNIPVPLKSERSSPASLACHDLFWKKSKKEAQEKFPMWKDREISPFKGGGGDGQNKTGARLMMESAEKV